MSDVAVNAAQDRQSSKKPGDVHILCWRPEDEPTSFAFRSLIQDMESEDIDAVLHEVGQTPGGNQATVGVLPDKVRSGSRARWYFSWAPMLKAWPNLSLSRNTRIVIRQPVLICKNILGIIRSLAVLVIKLPAALVSIPQDLKHFISGPVVTPMQVSPVAHTITQIASSKSRDHPLTIIVLATRLDILADLMEVDFLLPGNQLSILVLFASYEKASPGLVDIDLLDTRWQSSNIADQTRFFAADSRVAAAVERALSTDIASADALIPGIGSYPSTTDKSTSRKPVAIVIRPAWVFCGSTTVFSNQTEYLVKRGYQVMEIAVQQRFWGLEEVDQTTQDFMSNNRSSFAHKTLLLYLGVGLAPFVSLFFRRGRKAFRSGLARRGMMVELAQLPRPWHEALTDRPPQFVVVNHCWHMPLARELFPDSRLVLESHDIQAHQFDIHSRFYSGGSVSVNVDKALEDELEMMRPAEAVVTINDDERELIARGGGMPPLRTIYPYLPKSLVPDAAQQNQAQTRVTMLTADPIDVLLVASNHPANVVSLKWFINKVYKPFLLPTGMSILVVGDVADALSAEDLIIPFTGRVPDLLEYYERARIVALPVVEGAGLPIKTMEALSLGLPVVATSSSVRGLIGVERGIDTFNEPEAFAGQIKRLLGDESYRAKVAESGYEYAIRTFSKHAYFRAWDQLIADLDV